MPVNMHLKRNLTKVLKGDVAIKAATAALSNAALQSFDQVNSDPGFSVLVLVWAATRLAHRSGLSYADFTELARVAWEYSVEYDEQVRIMTGGKAGPAQGP
jgi:hypothetical protein